jgi:hypothetical protein
MKRKVLRNLKIRRLGCYSLAGFCECAKLSTKSCGDSNKIK